MKDKYIFNRKAYIYPFVLVVFMLYLSIITIYVFQIGIQLKTLDNIEKYYENQINLFLKKEDIFE
ncbi:hypothetical protein CW744_05045 [Staphylococcus xylosus]|nr:hypothetical protein CW744_05045 [Staphylococcus xylosus]